MTAGKLNRAHVAKLRSDLVKYQTILGKLIETLEAFEVAGLLSIKPSSVRKTLGQVDDVLALIDADEITASTIAKGWIRLDCGYTIVRYTQDDFVARLRGPCMVMLRNVESVWERLYHSWNVAVSEQSDGTYERDLAAIEKEHESEPDEDEGPHDDE
jgi:hypothetical protein